MTTDWAKRFFECAPSSQRWERQGNEQLSRDGRRFDTHAGFSIPIMRHFHSISVLISSCLIFCKSASGQSLELVLDLNPGARGSGPSYLTPFRGDIYFRANSGQENNELWRFDGTTAAQAADINPTGSSTPTDLTVADDTLFFAATDSTGATRLWSWNGTAAAKVAAASAVNLPQDMIAFKGALYFRGSNYSTVGVELFKLAGGALTAIDIYPGPGSGYPQNFAEYNGALYFSAGGQSGQGSELWRYDGATLSKAGQNIRPDHGSSPAWLCVYRDKLYFSAYDGVHGTELWRFDGTTSELVADQVQIASGSFNPAGMTVYKDALYFSANDQSGQGIELWKYDGIGMTLVADINPNPPGPDGDDFYADSTPAHFTVHDGLLYFTANDGTHGQELWVYDGENAPARVSDVHAGAPGSNMNGLRSVNGRLYLTAESGEGYGQELYRLVPAPVLDADEDGMPDAWELEHGLNITVNDAALDADFDGIPNGAEHTTGTNPADPISTFSAGLDRCTAPELAEHSRQDLPHRIGRRHRLDALPDRERRTCARHPHAAHRRARRERSRAHVPRQRRTVTALVCLSLDASGTSPTIHPMHRKTFSPGDIIFRQGDKSEEAYWIVSGKVEISIETPAGPDVLTTLDEGEIFGEMGMIDDQPRAATARVMAPTEVEVIDVADFQQQIVRREDRLMRYLDTLFDRLRTTNALLRAHLGKRWAEARLASGPPADRFHEVIPTLTILSTETSAGLYPRRLEAQGHPLPLSHRPAQR